MADSLEKSGVEIEHEARLFDKVTSEKIPNRRPEGGCEDVTCTNLYKGPHVDSSEEGNCFVGVETGKCISEAQLVKTDTDQFSCSIAELDIPNHGGNAATRLEGIVARVEGIDSQGVSVVAGPIGGLDLEDVSSECSLLPGISSHCFGNDEEPRRRHEVEHTVEQLHPGARSTICHQNICKTLEDFVHSSSTLDTQSCHRGVSQNSEFGIGIREGAVTGTVTKELLDQDSCVPHPPVFQSQRTLASDAANIRACEGFLVTDDESSLTSNYPQLVDVFVRDKTDARVGNEFALELGLQERADNFDVHGVLANYESSLGDCQIHILTEQHTGPTTSMDEVVRIDENLSKEVETGQTEENQAQGELIEVDNDSSSAADIDEIGMRLLKLDLAKDESTSYRVDQQKHHFGKGTGGNLAGVFTPLPPKAETQVKNAMMRPKWSTVLVFHKGSNIEVTGEILQCLLPGSWLNDEVINVYMELLKERESREPEKFLKCHFFNSFFYNKLFKDAQSYDYQAVRRWTTQKKLGYNLLECDKILVPVHQSVHWCLGVIDLRRQKLLYLDSLQGRDPNVLNSLARYIVDEARERGGQDLDVSKWEHVYVDDIPRQLNGCDCGMFMLKYADFHSRGASLSFTQSSMNYFRRRTAWEILQLKAT